MTRLQRERQMLNRCALGIVVLAILGALLSCRPQRPPLPDLGPTLAQLDRADRLLWEHRLAVAVHREPSQVEDELDAKIRKGRRAAR